MDGWVHAGRSCEVAPWFSAVSGLSHRRPHQSLCRRPSPRALQEPGSPSPRTTSLRSEAPNPATAILATWSPHRSCPCNGSWALGAGLIISPIYPPEPRPRGPREQIRCSSCLMASPSGRLFCQQGLRVSPWGHTGAGLQQPWGSRERTQPPGEAKTRLQTESGRGQAVPGVRPPSRCVLAALLSPCCHSAQLGPRFPASCPLPARDCRALLTAASLGAEAGAAQKEGTRGAPDRVHGACSLPRHKARPALPKSLLDGLPLAKSSLAAWARRSLRLRLRSRIPGSLV